MGDGWLHEIKHDGFRMLVRKADGHVRCFMKDGADCARWYPAVTVAARLLPVTSFTIDGEVVCCGDDGLPDFDLLRSHSHNHLAFVYAFDLLELAGEDLRQLAIEERKARLARLLKPLRGSGLAFVDYIEDDGPTIFRHACKLGFEGIVSKRKGSPYRSGPCGDWVKVKNPDCAAVRREREEDWGRARRPTRQRRPGFVT